jgi:hypothetical protein
LLHSLDQLDTLFNKGEDTALAKQYNMFVKEKTTTNEKGKSPSGVPKKASINIDEIKASLQKEITMLDTAINFKGGPQLPIPSYLSAHVSSVYQQ